MSDTATAVKIGDEKGAFDAFFEVGAHYGYSKTRRHPSMKALIFGAKNNVEIIDVEKMEGYLGRALEAVKGLAAGGKKILFVGTKNEARPIIKSAAESLNMPFVTERWVGGTFTNFEEIKKRVARLKELREERISKELEKYTKKERLLLEREEDRLMKLFGGVENMDRLPDAVFIVDTKREDSAVREAERMRIPIIALMSSDCDIKNADFPIPANDSATSSISFFVDKIAEAYRSGR